MKEKKNWLLIGGVVLLAAALLVLAKGMRTEAEENLVLISVNGQSYARVPLSRPQTVTVDQGNGCVNVIEVTSSGAVMQSSTCDNQICVHMGPVTLQNWELRANQQYIICLPNRVTVELVVKE